MSAPRLVNDVNYWLKKGKSGKNVCIITHDDLDGITSAILMKNYLLKHDFTIKQYGIINYKEGWTAFSLDKTLINIALDFSDDNEEVDIFIDHHGKFSEELTKTQKKHSVKISTGSAAEGVALQLGVSMSKDFKNWIDMIDSAKYDDYDVDIRNILDFDLKTIVSNPNSKMNFAAAMNQYLKRSEHRTFVEVINACEYPSIYNIFRLFKLFYPKNNPHHKSGDEQDFVEDGKKRIAEMTLKVRGESNLPGFNKYGTKIRYTSCVDFWKDFAQNVVCDELDDNNTPIPNSSITKSKVVLGGYQIIGNLMYVPSGTWANALRAKAIFSQDVDAGIVPNDTKLNFVLLQYGNTLQIADLRTKMKDMTDEYLPKDKKGNSISNLGKYTEGLLENFKNHLGYKDDRTVAGGHYGIGTCSNIFSKCQVEKHKDVKFLDMFKNKIINDLSGVQWNINMPWNEIDEANKIVPTEEVNKKLVNIEDVRTEKDVFIEAEEREILNYIISNNIDVELNSFKTSDVKKIYNIWLETGFDEIVSGMFKPEELSYLWFKKTKKIEKSVLFNKIVEFFELNNIYDVEKTLLRTKQRNEFKRIFKIMFNLINKNLYIHKDTDKKVKKFLEKINKIYETY
jgi:hypothetical protein